MRRLLMISPHFPPDSSAGTHRVRLLAPYLAEYGWKPTVLTVAEQDLEGRIDRDLARLVPPDLDVVRTRAWPARLTRHIGVGDLGLRALSGLHRTARRLHREHPFDAVFVTIYPTYPAVLGLMMKRRFRVPFVLDYQDPWVGAWGESVGGGPGGIVDTKSRSSRALAERLEPPVLRAADAVTAVSARTYEEALARTGSMPRAVAEIPIGWDAADMDAVANRTAHPRFVPRDGRLNICYVGTLLPLGITTLRTVLGAARALIEREPHLADQLRFHFFGTSNQTGGGEERVRPHARELGVEHLVHEHPARLDYLDALDALRQADVLLLLGSSERHYTPSKVFPALLAGHPMIAVYHHASTVIEVLRTAAPAPASQVITFDDHKPVEALIGGVADAIRRLACTNPSITVNRAALEPWSARTLAGKLAQVCDRIAA
jgi:glycosyltransferase involved in cell wall biosynthesis